MRPPAGRDDRARFEATGLLAVACARVATVEEILLDEAQELGGEMPVDRSAQLRAALTRTRRDLHAAIRGALLRGVAPRGIIEVAFDAGLDLDGGDLASAFEEHGAP